MTTKKQLVQKLTQNKYLAVTGRVESWLKDPESRYPVSCTVLSVEDTMEGQNGIEYAQLYVSKGLRYGAGVALDLSKIRPAGTTNEKGLVASGPVSFMQLFSKQNEILRRGGLFKNGAVTVYLAATHPDFVSFLQAEGAEYDWIKKSTYICDDPTSEDYILSPKFTDISIPEKRWTTTRYIPIPNTNPILYEKVEEEHVQPACSILDLILQKVRAGSLWLSKIRYDKEGKRLYTQVCHEILLQSNGTCLLSHVNLGMTPPNKLVSAFKDGMKFLCQLHSITGAGKDNYYLPPKKDRQVGLGVIGLANFLAKENLTYKGFAQALYDFGDAFKTMRSRYSNQTDKADIVSAVFDYLMNKVNNGDNLGSYGAKELSYVKKFYTAFLAASVIAERYKMDRAFTIAPTATCSYRYKDSLGYTTTPEISPPICHPTTKKVVRDSDTFGTVEYQYPPTVETAEQVGFQVYFQLVKGWQLMMEATDKAHCISFNLWNECPVDREWFEEWLNSPLVTSYYRMMEQQQYVDKSSIIAGLEAAKEAFSNEDDFFMPVDDDSSISLDSIFSSKKECPITPVLDDKGRCIPCGE